MTTQFDRWEKDPYFSVAEEVQESADRMESTYRTWLHCKRDTSGLWNIDELSRDLQTVLGTTKWQLEEFERAVNSSYKQNTVDDSKDRHRDFITAIEGQVLKVEKCLNASTTSQGKPPKPWVRLDEGEYDELASFLSGSSMAVDKSSTNRIPKDYQQSTSSVEADKSSTASTKNQIHGHRRTASASADIGSWQIAITDDLIPRNLGNDQPPLPPRKVPSLSGFLNTLEKTSTKLKWPKNGYRKLKLTDNQDSDTLPRTLHLTKGLNACFERSGCDDCYDNKQLYGWCGTIQRQLQRSQYHVQYSRPVQLIFSLILLVCIIVILVMHAS